MKKLNRYTWDLRQSGKRYRVLGDLANLDKVLVLPNTALYRLLSSTDLYSKSSRKLIHIYAVQAGNEETHTEFFGVYAKPDGEVFEVNDSSLVFVIAQSGIPFSKYKELSNRERLDILVGEWGKAE